MVSRLGGSRTPEGGPARYISVVLPEKFCKQMGNTILWSLATKKSAHMCARWIRWSVGLVQDICHHVVAEPLTCHASSWQLALQCTMLSDGLFPIELTTIKES